MIAMGKLSSAIAGDWGLSLNWYIAHIFILEIHGTDIVDAKTFLFFEMLS